jgi:glycosyltransferase involved in cell wall biosynthesis
VRRWGPEAVRVLLIAEEANPEWVSVPLVGWSHSRALARAVGGHIVTQVRNREAFLRARVPESEFTAIDSEAVARRVYRLASALRGGSGKGWTTNTALSAVSYMYFERLLWQQFGRRIVAREFDVVHRVTPLSPTIPSPIAARCARAGVPFVLGPLNGGVPWPRGFDSARRREREWLSYVRGAYRWIPGYRATRRHAAAIIVGSLDTLAQMPGWCRARCVYIPENAVEPDRFPRVERPAPGRPLRVAFVGRLVPYKGADMLVEAAAPLVRAGAVSLDIIGDGPEMPAIREQVQREGIGQGVQLRGWIEHAQVREGLSRADVFGFPSIREFGGGVVLEAMALGVVPVVMDYGGPGELVTERTGFRVPMGPRGSIVAALRAVLQGLVEEPGGLREIGRRAQERVASLFTWEAKAAQVAQVYDWVLGRRADRPDFGAPLTDRPERDTEAPASWAGAGSTTR